MAELEYPSVELDPHLARRDQLTEKRESVLDHIGAELERLSRTVTELEQRLRPVLTPFGAIEEMAAVPQPPQSQIREHRDALSSQIGRLQRLVDQLEV